MNKLTTIEVLPSKAPEGMCYKSVTYGSCFKWDKAVYMKVKGSFSVVLVSSVESSSIGAQIILHPDTLVLPVKVTVEL